MCATPIGSPKGSEMTLASVAAPRWSARNASAIAARAASASTSSRISCSCRISKATPLLRRSSAVGLPYVPGGDAVCGVVVIADLADACVGHHRHQQGRLGPGDVVVLHDPFEKLAVRLACAPLERLARDQRRERLARLY